MARLLLVLSLALAFVSISVFGDELDSVDLTQTFHGLTQDGDRYAKTVARGVRDDVDRNGLKAIATYSDRALDALVNRACDELEKAGDTDYANYHRSDWKLNFSGLWHLDDSHDIGDHPEEALSSWLDSFYAHVEFVLGVDLCRSLHISDIKSINDTVKIVFHACTFPMDAVLGSREDEYRNHFNEGQVYYGLTPVVVYWACEIGMMAAGAPVPFVCSAAEFAYAKFLGGRLSDMIFSRACGG